MVARAGRSMSFHFRRPFKIGSGVQGTGVSYTDRTPTTPIPQGRNTPGGMVAAFVLIGFLVLAIALFA